MMIHFKQEHSKTCGVAAMRMMLNAFGEEITENDFMKLVTIHSYGIFSTELAIPFLKKGFKATACTWNLPVLAHLNLAIGAKIVEKHLNYGLATPSTKAVAQSIVQYLKTGGKLFWQPPTLALLRKIVSKNPALVSVNTASLGDYWRHWDNGHYLVVSEVGKEKSFVHDPYYDEKKGSYWIENERLIPAITVNAIRSTDFCMMIEK